MRRGKLITIGAGLGTWLFGVGVSAGLVLIQGGLTADSRRRLQWTVFPALGLALVVWALTWIARAGRARMLRRNGVAYLVRERAQGWVEDSPDDFYAEVRERFADVVAVPRSEEVGRAWDWPLDGSGALLWDAKVTELVRTFRVLRNAVHARHAEEGTSGVPDAIFVTAWWAVALAFGRRLGFGIRNWELNVWQRPSDFRAGRIDPVLWRQRPHQFTGQAVSAPPGLMPQELTWDVDLTVARPDGAVGEVESRAPVSVLLLRFGRSRWGSLPLEEPGRPVPLTLIDAGGVTGAKEPDRVRVHELRCVPRDGARAFDWDDFPFLVATAVDWIQRKALELDGQTLLLAATIPNEVALGIGIAAGRPDCDGWPSAMWPVIYRQPANALVIPRLNLGATLPAE